MATPITAAAPAASTSGMQTHMSVHAGMAKPRAVRSTLRPSLAPTHAFNHAHSAVRPRRSRIVTRPMAASASADAGGAQPEKSVDDARFKPVESPRSQSYAEALGIAEAEPASLKDRIFKKVADSASIAALFAVWYGSNIYFNIYNKQVLQVFPMPVSCTLIHLAVGSVIMLALWATKLRQAPPLDRRVVDTVGPLAILHTAGFLLTNCSLGAVAVSLTHTIKALEPFFTVILSWIFLAAVPKLHIVITLLPIVAGVVIASATDVSFNWMGFLTAMGSNLAFQGRNVLSKRIMVRSSLDSLEGGMVDTGPQLDDVQLFGCITLGGFLMMIPCVLLMEGNGLMAMASAGTLSDVMSGETLTRALMAGVCRLADVLSSFAILKKVSPVTHSVGNCVKRVAVIAVSIVFFRTPASFLNVLGTAIALGGVFAYSMAMAADKRRAMSTATRKAAVQDRGLLPGPVVRALRRRKAAKLIKERAKTAVLMRAAVRQAESADAAVGVSMDMGASVKKEDKAKVEKKEKKKTSDDDETDLEYYL